jgi:hypothetical protein
MKRQEKTSAACRAFTPVEIRTETSVDFPDFVCVGNNAKDFSSLDRPEAEVITGTEISGEQDTPVLVCGGDRIEDPNSPERPEDDVGQKLFTDMSE